MQKEQFIQYLKEALEIPDGQDVSPETDLTNLEEYDSLSVLAVIALIDEQFSQKLSASDFTDITTVQSLMDKIGSDHFE